ncbi:MAG: arginase [Planktomarina sp.]|nr:arginase [Planktomarina sp.]
MYHHCTILGLPLQAGTGRGGCLMGPDAFRTAGIGDVITSQGLGLNDLGNLSFPNEIPQVDGPGHLKKLSEIVAWTRNIQTEATALSMLDTFPIFIGGDHSMAAGTLTGVALAAQSKKRPQFVLWLDAHPDMNTLISTISGHLHGTPMAYALGMPSFDDIFPPVLAPLDPKNVCMIGLRSVDEPEHRFISNLGMDVYDMRRIDEVGVAKPVSDFLDRVAAANGLLHVSFDVDFLDPEIAPAVGTTVPGGATFREAHLIMEMVHDSGLASSLDLTELNPFLDIRGKTATLMCDLTASLLGKKVLDRRTRGF